MDHYNWLTKESDIQRYQNDIKKTELQLDDFKTIKNEFINNQFNITKNINDRPKAFVGILARAFLSGINDAAIDQITGELTKEYSPERCFCELIQNIDDCTYDGEEVPDVNIKFDKENNTITLSYNERGFNYADVNGICQYNETSKLIFEKIEECSNSYFLSINKPKKNIGQNKEGVIFSYYQTGEKGIGFKAIYQITKRVRIKSGDFDFFIINEHFANKNIRKIPIPMWNYSVENEKNQWNYSVENEKNQRTKITLYLKDEIKDKFDEIKGSIINNYFCGSYDKEVNLLLNNNILFTKKLQKVCIDTDTGYTYINNGGAICSLNSENDNGQIVQDNELDYWEGIIDCHEKECVYAKQELTYSFNITDDKPDIQITRYINTVVFEANTVAARYQEKFVQSGNDGEFCSKKQTRNISFAVVKENNKINLTKEGGFYTTLPLEDKTNAPFSIDAPFILNKSRSQIYFPTNNGDTYAENILMWNRETIKKVREGYIKLLLQNREDIDFIKHMICVKGISSEEKDISGDDKGKLEQYLENEIWKVPNDIEIVKLSDNQEEKYMSIRDVYFFDNVFYYGLPKYTDLAIKIEKNVCSVNIGDKAYIEGDNSILIKQNNILKLNMVKSWNTYVENTFSKAINQKNDLSWFKTELILALKSSGMKYCSELKIFVDGSSLVSQKEIAGIIVRENNKSSVGCIHTTKSVLPNIDINDHNINNFFEDSIIDNEQDKIKEAIQKYIEKSIDKNSEYEDIRIGYISVLLGATEFGIDFSEIKFGHINRFGISDKNDWFSKYLWTLEWDESENQIKDIWENMVISCRSACKDRLPNVASQIFGKVDETDLKTKILCALLREDKANSEENKSSISCDKDSIISIFEAIDKYYEINEESDTNNTSNVKKLYNKIENYFQIMITDENVVKRIDGDEKSEDIKAHAVAVLNELTKEENKEVQLNVYSVPFSNENYNYVRIKEVLICNENKFIESIKNYIRDFEKKDKAGHFQNRLELLKMKNSISTFEVGQEKEFIESLNNYRRTQCECGFDVSNLVKELQNNSGEVWPEILQNINDAREDLSDKDKNDPTRVIIDDQNKTLTLEYNEKGFDFKDIKGITDLGNGSKADTTQTGEKGIGFKAVYRWAYRIEIHSMRFHFAIGPDKEPDENSDDIVKNCTVPSWVGNDNSDEQSAVTKMVLYLKNDVETNKICDAIKNVANYLCLDNIGEITFTISGKVERLWKRTEDVDSKYFSYKKKLRECFKKEDDFETWIRTRGRWMNLSDKKLETLKNKLEIQYYFVKEFSKEERECNKCIWNYATLPLSKPKELFPAIIINAPFATDISRKSIVDDDYNKKLTEIINDKFGKAVEKATCDEKNSNGESLQKYFKDKEGGILFYLKGLDNCYRTEIKKLNLFTCYCKNKKESVQEIIECKKSLNDIIAIKDHLIYSLLEKLNNNNFISSVNYLRNPDNNVDAEESIRDSFILSVLNDSNKAILKKTEKVMLYEIDEIINWIEPSDNQQLEIQPLIAEFIKKLKLPKEGYLADESNQFVQFVKELWKKIYAEKWDRFDRACPVYPFICKDKDGNSVTKLTMFRGIEGESDNKLWCYDLAMEHFSTDYYKIIDLDWLVKVNSNDNENEQMKKDKRNDALTEVFDTTYSEELKKYGTDVEKVQLDKLLNKEEKYSDKYWKILRRIYDLLKGGDTSGNE